MKYSKRVAQLKASLTLAITSKAKEMKKNGIDVVSFGAGEPDFDTPDNVKQAAIEAINKGFTKYTAVSGMPELKTAICEKFRDENNLSYSPEEIVVSCGAKHSLFNIFQAICDEGDEILVISPYWLSYPEMIRLSGAQPKFIHTDEKNSFVPDPKEINKLVTNKTKAILINSPSNPTGAYMNKEVLEEIAKIAVSRNTYVISDEIYEKLLYDDKKHISIGSLGEDIFKLTFTVNGVSKSCSMTGWRIGYLGGPRDIVDKISAFQSHSTSNPTSISQVASVEAIKNTASFAEKMKRPFAERRDYMVRRINSFKGISCVSPAGAFYIFCNITETKLDSISLSERLLEEAHVACVPGIAFGSDAHIRLSFATSMENIKKGLDRMEEWFNKL